MTTMVMPWCDRAGRLSWLKLVTFVLLFVPGVWIAVQLAAGWLAPKPVTEAIHQTGFWAVRFLLISLAVTPLRRLGAWGKLIAVRRMLGLTVLAYALVHFTLYIIDQHFDLKHVASEIVLRFYLTIGFVALVGFAVLGSTSTDAMIRRLGGKAWNRLHKLVYLLAFLGIWHFMLQAKLDVTQPVLMAGLLMILLGYRVLQARGWADTIVPLLMLAVVASLGTALLEAGWYQVVNHVPYRRVLDANLDFDDTFRSAWWVLLVGLAAVALRLLRPLWSRKAPPPRARASAVRATV